MTLGTAAAAGVRPIVWRKECWHQVEPDPAEMARQYSSETADLDWCERPVCSGASGPAGPDHRRETSGRLRHLREIGPTPQLEAPKSRRNPGKFHSAV
jgi:hypothetical protein